MLVLTQEASRVIDRIGTGQQTSPALGVRISRGGVSTNPLGVSLARGPHDGDQVVESAEGRVYLGRHAVDALRGKTLGARTDDSGRIEFTISETAA